AIRLFSTLSHTTLFRSELDEARDVLLVLRGLVGTRPYLRACRRDPSKLRDERRCGDAILRLDRDRREAVAELEELLRGGDVEDRSEEHTSELQSQSNLV